MLFNEYKTQHSTKRYSQSYINYTSNIATVILSILEFSKETACLGKIKTHSQKKTALFTVYLVSILVHDLSPYQWPRKNIQNLTTRFFRNIFFFHSWFNIKQKVGDSSQYGIIINFCTTKVHKIIQQPLLLFYLN